MNASGGSTVGFCGKGHSDWSTWTSSSGVVRPYCKACRRLRAKSYAGRKKGSGASHSKAQFRDLVSQYDRCPNCQRLWEDIPPSRGQAKFTITEDHIVPLAAGGSDGIDNIRPLCYQCNFRKGWGV